MSQALARFLVFFTSASVLVIEILAVRLLAPYLGVSLAVFTGVIGVILAGISVGAWLGGRLADRRAPGSLLGPILVAGGLTAMVSPMIVDAVGPNLSNDPGSIILATAVGFFLPAAVLSMVPPIVVKIRLSSLEETGSVVGSYSAIGTGGAIFGTFITGFVLVAAFPTRPIVAVVGGLLTILGIVLWSTRSKWMRPLAGVALLAIGLVLVLVPGPCDVETTYHCAIVLVDERRPSGRILVLDRLWNSYVDVDDPTFLRFDYIKTINDTVTATQPDGPLTVVSLGGGGMTYPSYVDASRPGSTNTVLEIDGGVVDLVHREFGLSPTIDVVVAAARVSLRSVLDSSANVVVGDAFSGASVPWHLTTVEHYIEIRRVLTPSGIYTMNVIDAGQHRFVRATANTLDAVFDHVALFAPASLYQRGNVGNFVFVASMSPIDIDGITSAIQTRQGNEVGIDGSALSMFAGGTPILRDDFAPVDQMLGR